MPEEMRCVFFDPEEVRTLVCEFLSSRTGLQNTADIGRIELWPDPQGVRAGFTRGSSNRLAGLDASELLAAVVMFCHSCRIPLPIRAHKYLQLAEDTLVLAVRRTPRTATTVTPPPKVMARLASGGQATRSRGG